MRTNSSKKVHKMKQDPFRTLLRIAGILAAGVVIGIGLVYLCSMAITSDYNATRERILAQNAEDEVQFNTRMNELREQNSVVSQPLAGGETVRGDLPVWEKEIFILLMRK